MFRPLYNVQLNYDLDSPLILSYDVFPQTNENGTLQTMIDGPARSAYVDDCAKAHRLPMFVVIGFDPAVYQDGFDLYEDRSDKDWSLTDCISFAVMTERGLSEALTGDHHFEQAGFRAMFK